MRFRMKRVDQNLENSDLIDKRTLTYGLMYDMYDFASNSSLLVSFLRDLVYPARAYNLHKNQTYKRINLNNNSSVTG